MYYSVCTLDFDLLTAVALHVQQELLRMHIACVQLRVALTGDIFIVSLMTGASSFQIARLAIVEASGDSGHTFVSLRNSIKLNF